MGRKKLSGAKTMKDIAVRKAMGQSDTAIAADYGVSQPTVTRFVHKEDVMALVEQAHLEILAESPGIAKNYIAMAKTGAIPGIPDDKPEDKQERARKASKDLLTTAGILPSGAPSHLTVNFYQNFSSKTEILNPKIMAIISKDLELPEGIDPDDLV